MRNVIQIPPPKQEGWYSGTDGLESLWNLHHWGILKAVQAKTAFSWVAIVLGKVSAVNGLSRSLPSVSVALKSPFSLKHSWCICTQELPCTEEFQRRAAHWVNVFLTDCLACLESWMVLGDRNTDIITKGAAKSTTGRIFGYCSTCWSEYLQNRRDLLEQEFWWGWIPVVKCLRASFFWADKSPAQYSLHWHQPQPGEETAALPPGTWQQDAHHLCAQQREKLRPPWAASINSLAQVWLRNSLFLL